MPEVQRGDVLLVAESLVEGRILHKRFKRYGLNIDWSREAVKLALLLGGPLLAVALVVGLLVGVAQTLTQMHDPVAGQVPRLVAVLVAALVALPWLLGRWVAYAVDLIGSLPERL